ncbi:MAG TPA: NADPH:quinone oxidoreductase family protein [Stellaceae bacterium]|nr:NADPH:quinone oxidoreductase family protein [Stellaceae bacterium]
MKAVLCKSFGPPSALVVEEVAALEPGDGQVVVAVKACGVNFPDTLMIQGKYQFKPDFPFSPGGEVAGTVMRLGPGTKRFKVGDRVIASVGWGGFAQEVLAKEERIIPIPPGMDFIPASAFLLTYGTSLHALKDRAHLSEGETLLVLGAAGGVGIAAIEIGKAMGAKVIACASSQEKLDLCREHGADETINYTTENLRDRVRALTKDKGVDVVYDAVGGPYSEPALRSIAWEGRFLVVGFAAGDIPRIPLNLPLLKSCSVVGVFWGAFLQRDQATTAAHLSDLVTLYASGKVHPHISATYPLERAGEALQAMMERRVKGKIVITP